MKTKSVYLILLCTFFSSCVPKNKDNIIAVNQILSVESQIIEKLKSIFYVSNDQKIMIDKITEGRSDSAIFKASFNNKTYIIRMLSPERALDERKWEIDLLQETAKKNISPHVYYCSSDAQMIIMDYVRGENFFGSIARQSSLLQSLAHKLHHLHSLPISPLAPKILSLEKHFFLKTDINEYQELVQNFKRLEKKFLENAHLAITHTDIHPGNLIANQKDVWIIDWQDAGLYNPLYDLARFVVDLQLPIKEEAIFINAYFNRDMTLHEKLNYYRAKKMVYIKIIDSLMAAYTKDLKEKDLSISKLFDDAKQKLSLEELSFLTTLSTYNFNEMSRKMKDSYILRLVILYFIQEYRKL